VLKKFFEILNLNEMNSQRNIVIIGDGKWVINIQEFLENNAEDCVVFDSVWDLPMKIIQKLDLIIFHSEKETEEKLHALECLGQIIGPEIPILINLESQMLSTFQKRLCYHNRLIGVKWSFPIESNYFLELISNGDTAAHLVERITAITKADWLKRTVVSTCGFSIGERLFAAIVREGMFLVDQGYADIESVDRACRNDAGFYIPFVGNFRYMDLMGVYAYGRVMYDLNPELAKNVQFPPFAQQVLSQGGDGVSNGRGFYTYDDDGKQHMLNKFKEFTIEMKQIIAQFQTMQDNIVDV